MQKELKEYCNQIYGILGNSIYGIYDAETVEKIKLKINEEDYEYSRNKYTR